MSLFRSLSADREPLETFRSKVPKDPAERTINHTPKLPIHLFEWSQGQHGTDESGLLHLRSQTQSSIRVIFAPQDVPSPSTIDGLCDFFERHRIPSAFIAEGISGVSQSFAARKDVDGTTNVWFHFLAKDLPLLDGKIVHLQGTEPVSSAEGQRVLQVQSQSQASFTWIKPGFVLRIKAKQPTSNQTTPPLPRRATTSGSEDTLVSNSSEPQVEMFCFGAPVTLRDRFQKLKDIATCEELLQDPYVLLEIVLEEMYKVMDQTAWRISDIFGEVETETLGMASTPGKAATELPRTHFTGLHNLAKHCIYLRENCEAALATLEGLRNHHLNVIGSNPRPERLFTQQALEYQKTLFQSTQRRLSSLDARMTNIIQLSFHIVTQGDSRMMQTENQSMKTIAVMTLIFMPLGTVAGVFGTEFMKVDDEAPYHISVSQDFWLLWLIAIPLTGFVLLFWRVWYTDAKGRLIDEIPQEAKRRMGWKTVQRTLWKPEGSKKGQYAVVVREVTPKETFELSRV